VRIDCLPAQRYRELRLEQLAASMTNGGVGMVTQFELAVDRDGDGTVVIACRGDLDLSTREEFEQALETSLDGDVRVLRLDLHALQFIDSTGLRELIRAQRDCDEHGIRLEVVPSAVVGRLLELTDALRHFTIVERPA
jgi:anti-anti-sigma factor